MAISKTYPATWSINSSPNSFALPGQNATAKQLSCTASLTVTAEKNSETDGPAATTVKLKINSGNASGRVNNTNYHVAIFVSARPFSIRIPAGQSILTSLPPGVKTLVGNTEVRVTNNNFSWGLNAPTANITIGMLSEFSKNTAGHACGYILGYGTYRVTNPITASGAPFIIPNLPVVSYKDYFPGCVYWKINPPNPDAGKWSSCDRLNDEDNNPSNGYDGRFRMYNGSTWVDKKNNNTPTIPDSDPKQHVKRWNGSSWVRCVREDASRNRAGLGLD